MKFCKTCGSMMQVQNKKWFCGKCNIVEDSKKGEGKIVTLEETSDKLLILDEAVQILPTARMECPKCKHMKVEWWLIQTRSADESETRFHRCLKCKYTWREYD